MKFHRTQRVQDSVHGLMEFVGPEGLIVDILSTPELQRLRRIRQLGLGYLVFPGAEHSRLSHSLGASFMGLRFARQLREATRGSLAEALVPGDESIRDFGIAALCHDLGHGPLSHTWEREVIGHRFDRGAWIVGLGLQDHAAKLADAKWHEMVTQALLRWPGGSLHRLLEEHEAGFSERIANLLLGDYYIPYLPRLLSSDIDVDRADFLKRDAAMSGARYDYDLAWLISTCQVVEDEHRDLVVAFDERKGLSVVQQFLMARKALYDTVYYHKTVRAAEGMVGLFLRRFRDTGAGRQVSGDNPFVRALIRILSGEVLNHEELTYMDDYGLFVLITEVSRNESVDPTLRDLAQRIATRNLFTEVPVAREHLAVFFDAADAHEQLFDLVSRHVDGDPAAYVYPDRISFEWFEVQVEHQGYLSDKSGIARELRHHSALQRQSPYESYLRLFTIREAAEDMANLVNPHN